MEKVHAPNAIPKIIVLAKGNPLQHLIIFIPGFKKEWHKRMDTIKEAELEEESGQWVLPYSEFHIQKLEAIFGEHILFAFRINWLSGEHKTDIV